MANRSGAMSAAHEPAESAAPLLLAGIAKEPRRPVSAPAKDAPSEPSATTLPLATASQRLRGRPGRPRTKPRGDSSGDSPEPQRMQVREMPGRPPIRRRAQVTDPPASRRLPEPIIRHARPVDPSGRATSRSARAGQPQCQEGVVRPSRPRQAGRPESDRLKTGDFGRYPPPTPKKSARSCRVGSASATRTNFHTPFNCEAQ